MNCSLVYIQQASMLFVLVILASSLEVALLQTSNELIPFEPIQYLKLQSVSVNESSFWNQLLEAGPEEIGSLASSIKRNLHGTFRETDAVIFAKGERIITKKLSSKSILDKLSRVPYANLIALCSVSMTILLEGFQSKLINEPIGEILKGKDLLNPIIKGYESRSLLEILGMLLVDSEALVDDSDVMMDELNRNGKAAIFFVNSILGDSASEAWMDALMAFNIENTATDPDQLELSLHNIFQYVLTVIHDFHHMKKATNVNLPLQNQRYLFGWWLNCLGSSNCVFSDLPRDLIFSVSSSLRIYVSPAFELSLIILESKSTRNSLKEVIAQDRMIWEKISAALNAENESTKFDGETIQVSTETSTSYLLLIRQVWPILVFVFWVVSSHIWVYWMLHCFWFMATALSKRTHIPRPKLAAN